MTYNDSVLTHLRTVLLTTRKFEETLLIIKVGGGVLVGKSLHSRYKVALEEVTISVLTSSILILTIRGTG